MQDYNFPSPSCRAVVALEFKRSVVVLSALRNHGDERWALAGLPVAQVTLHPPVHYSCDAGMRVKA